MGTKIYNAAGDLIRQSANLRGLLEHARRELPITLECGAADVDGNYPIRVHFLNGDYAWTRFADWRVAGDWFATRRNWGRLSIGWANNNGDFAARFLQSRIKRDGRYQVKLEFCGFETQRYVVRFCRDYVGVADTESEAYALAVWHDAERMKGAAA